jgi:hypothetical protein
MVVETTSQLGPWAAGGAPTLRGVDTDEASYIGQNRTFGGLHSQGNGWFRKTYPAMVGMADGSTRRIEESISKETFGR